jgi:hypothetical protein
MFVANGAGAMQAAPCGHRAGILGSFRETFATRQPNMRRRHPQSRDASRKFRENAL